jgi:hypothetical protein
VSHLDRNGHASTQSLPVRRGLSIPTQHVERLSPTAPMFRIWPDREWAISGERLLCGKDLVTLDELAGLEGRQRDEYDIQVSRRADLSLAPTRMRRASTCAVVTGGACSEGAWRGAETLAEAARKMRVVAEAAGVGNIAERPACLH